MTCHEPGCIRTGDGHTLHRDTDGDLWIVGNPNDLPPSDQKGTR